MHMRLMEGDRIESGFYVVYKVNEKMINSNDVVPYVVNGVAMNSFSQFLHNR